MATSWMRICSPCSCSNRIAVRTFSGHMPSACRSARKGGMSPKRETIWLMTSHSANLEEKDEKGNEGEGERQKGPSQGGGGEDERRKKSRNTTSHIPTGEIGSPCTDRRLFPKKSSRFVRSCYDVHLLGHKVHGNRCVLITHPLSSVGKRVAQTSNRLGRGESPSTKQSS